MSQLIHKAFLALDTNGQAALVSASSLTDRVFHIIQPPGGGEINVTFQNIWIAQGVATDGGSDAFPPAKPAAPLRP